MHTLAVISAGLALLGACLGLARLAVGGSHWASKGAIGFLPLWLVGAAVNLWVGVSTAGYSVAEEAPIFALVFAVPAALALAGCASTPSPTAPEAPVSDDAEDATRGVRFHDNPMEGEPTLVSPRPGMANVRPHAFAAATMPADDRSLRVVFWGGIAPCFVLDRVEVREAAHTVTVTLLAGSDPASPNVACIEIAMLMAVDVSLPSPLAGRVVVDGADGSTKSGAP